MDIMLERLIDVGGVFLVLSLVVEKIGDFIKLNKENLRRRPPKAKKPEDIDEERVREGKILSISMLIGVILAFFLKADAVQILVSGEPGEVIGWENVFVYNEDVVEQLSMSNAEYYYDLGFRGTFRKGVFSWLFAIIGISITGVALSFGSKFWHDLIGVLYEVKEAKAKGAGRR